MLWQALADALSGRRPEPCPELGVNEHLLAAVVGILKPDYVGQRWSILDDDETWEEQRGIAHSLLELMPVELLLRSLAGHLQYLGAGSPQAVPLLEALGIERRAADKIAHGTVLAALLQPPRPPGPHSFPPELALLDRSAAPHFGDLVASATLRYRDADERRAAEVGGYAFADDSPDDDLDRNVFSTLAQLAAVYDVLLGGEREVIFARTL